MDLHPVGGFEEAGSISDFVNFVFRALPWPSAQNYAQVGSPNLFLHKHLKLTLKTYQILWIISNFQSEEFKITIIVNVPHTQLHRFSQEAHQSSTYGTIKIRILLKSTLFIENISRYATW
jgi:hypothetical protein